MQDSYIPHVMGGVDKLRAEGFTGKGVFIGFLDTGIDYMHPALGKGFGPGFKVIAGKNLVEDEYITKEASIPNDDLVSNLGVFFLVAQLLYAHVLDLFSIVLLTLRNRLIVLDTALMLLALLAPTPTRMDSLVLRPGPHWACGKFLGAKVVRRMIS